jgi:hypothetical protein
MPKVAAEGNFQNSQSLPGILCQLRGGKTASGILTDLTPSGSGMGQNDPKKNTTTEILLVNLVPML